MTAVPNRPDAVPVRGPETAPPRDPSAAGGAAFALGGPGSTARALESALRVTRPQWRDGASAPSAYETCLPPLLDALGWTGETRHLVDALPYVDSIETLDTFRAVLARLGFESEVVVAPLEGIDGPVVYLLDDAPHVAGPADPSPRPGQKVVLCKVWQADAVVAEPGRRPSWFATALQDSRSGLVGAIGLTLLVNLFAVATPLFSMFVYNAVIPGERFATLGFALAMIAVALVTEDYLRRLRVRILANVAARLHVGVMGKGVAKILALPIGMIESVSTTAQMAQLKRFESILGVFHGPAAAALFDLPCIIVFMLLIAVIGGPLVFVPLALVIVFAVLAAIMGPLARQWELSTASARRDAQELVRETVLATDRIREAGAERIWRERLAMGLDAEAAAVARQEAASQLAGHSAQFLAALASCVLLAAGAAMAIEGALSIGALIAVVMLGWRVLSPVQTLFLSLDQLASVRDDARMVDSLMRFEDEQRLGQAARIYRRFDGRLQFESVGLRHPGARSLALRNVSLEVAPGERIGVAGPSGSGKSTLLRLALGLTPPTVGAVALDGLPYSQLDVGELRTAFGFAPDRPNFFYGTVAQNMRLARPDVSDAEIEELLEGLELPLDPELFPDGLGTRLTASARAALGAAALQKLNVARALLSERPVLLLDEPTAHLDDDARAALVGQLERRRDRCATLLATNDRRLLARCDRVLLLAGGRVAAYDESAAVLRQFGDHRS